MSEHIDDIDESADDDDEEMEEGEEVQGEEDEGDDDNGEGEDDERMKDEDNDNSRAETESDLVAAGIDASAATRGNFMDAPFTQDSTLTNSVRNSLEFTQDTLEPEYDDEEEDEEDDDGEDDIPREDVEDHQPDDVGGDKNIADETNAAEANDEEDTSLEEVEADENTGKDETKLETEIETKVEAPATKGTQTKTEATSYSTRGRAHEENNFDRLAAVGDLLSLGATHRDATSAAILQSPETRIRESFLSDSLTEEERRTRTRFIPAVDGMHALRKQEIKNDLAIARSTLSSVGVTEKLVRITKRKYTDDEATGMDVTDSVAMSGDDAAMSTEEDKGNGGVASKTVEIGSTTLNIPSPAFVAPSLDSTTKKPTPREIDVVVAFNPPRPPESIGAKKKHRMLRWERRPSDIESDLNSYRKTVQKTREELKSAEGELDRIRVVDNQLRRHFLQHIRCMNEEAQLIGDEIATIQQECVDMADLPSNRTRTRGAFKGNNAMKDVLHTLRAKGKELEAKGVVLNGIKSLPAVSNPSGAGGVTASSFVDWDRSTIIDCSKLAEPWVVPGDKVKTPYGVGTVHSVHGPTGVNVLEPPNQELFPKTNPAAIASDTTDAMEIDEQDNQVVLSKKKGAKTEKKVEPSESNSAFTNVIAPRIAVRLPFGVAFFNLNSIKSEEDPSTYSDDQLAKRWLGIAETASIFGSSLNVSAMSNIVSPEKKDAGITSMDGDEKSDDVDVNCKESKKLVPFGASLFPTVVGRGTNLHKASMAELDDAVNITFFKGQGILGDTNNKGVPNEVRTLEDQRQEHLVLKAKVLQLRNQLYRQRRIRMLNERTYIASQERATKVESLVAEMRMDLKSLKGRLDVEIHELGISEEQAESILKAYYTSQDSQHTSNDVASPSRMRRLSQMNDTYNEQQRDKHISTKDTVEMTIETDASITAMEQ